MGLFQGIKQYKKKLEKKFGKYPKRRQLNFLCDSRLFSLYRSLAAHLEGPAYCVLEHALEIALPELATVAQDKALRENLQRHLLRRHLLVQELQPMEEVTSKRLRRLHNTLRLCKFLENWCSLEDQREIIKRLINEVTTKGRHIPSTTATDPEQADGGGGAVQT